MRRLALAALAAACAGFTCSPQMPIPMPDACDSPAAGAATDLVLGQGDTFAPFTDGQVVELVAGGQGFQMLPIRMKLRGDIPACIMQEATVLSAGRVEPASSSVAVKTYAESDGSFTTRPLYIILGAGHMAGEEELVTVTAGGRTASLTLFVHEKGVAFDFATPVDAGDLGG